MSDDTDPIDKYNRRMSEFAGAILLMGGALFISFFLVIIGDIPTSDRFTMFLVGIFLFMGGAGLGMTAISEYRIYQLVRDTPTTAVRSTAAGIVEVAGSVELLDDRLTAPSTGSDCAVYQYRIGGRDWGGAWSTMDSGTVSTPFLLDDDTGRILVEPSGAALDLEYSREFTVEEKDALPVQPEVDDDETSEYGSYRYREAAVTPGTELYIFGMAQEREEEATPTNARNLVIDANVGVPTMIISENGEEGLRSLMIRNMRKWVIGAALGIPVGFAIILAMVGLL